MPGETEPASPLPRAGMPAGPLEPAPRLQWARLQALGQGLTLNLHPLREMGVHSPNIHGGAQKCDETFEGQGKGGKLEG